MEKNVLNYMKDTRPKLAPGWRWCDHYGDQRYHIPYHAVHIRDEYRECYDHSEPVNTPEGAAAATWKAFERERPVFLGNAMRACSEPLSICKR